MNKKITAILFFIILILAIFLVIAFNLTKPKLSKATTPLEETSILSTTTETTTEETTATKAQYPNIDETINYTISNEKEAVYNEKLLGQNNLIEIKNITFDKALAYNLYEYTYIENQQKTVDNTLTHDKKVSYLQLKYKSNNTNENAINNALKAHLQPIFNLPNFNIYDRRGFAYSCYGKINNNIISYCTLYQLDNPNGGAEELITTNIYLNYDSLKNFEAIHLQLSDFIEDFNALSKYYLENKCNFYNPENSYAEDGFEKFNTDKEVNQNNIEALSKTLKNNETKWFITKDNELVIFSLYMDIFNAGYSVKLNDIKEMLTPNAFKLLNNEPFNVLEDENI